MTTTSALVRAAALPVFALALLLAGCGGGATGTGASPAPSTSTGPSASATDDSDADGDTDGGSDTDGDTGTDTDADADADEPGAAEEGAAATPDACGFTADDYATVRGALQTSNYAAIGLYLADSVYVTYASTEDEGLVDHNPGLVLQNLQDVSYPGLTWTFDIPASDLAAWAASPYYAEDFTDCAIVGITSDDRGVSLTVADGEITRELITFAVEAWGY